MLLGLEADPDDDDPDDDDDVEELPLDPPTAKAAPAPARARNDASPTVRAARGILHRCLGVASVWYGGSEGSL